MFVSGCLSETSTAACNWDNGAIYMSARTRRRTRGACHLLQSVGGDIKMRKTIMARTKSRNVSGGVIPALVLGVWGLASIPAHAQVVGGSLSGTITDESGAAIPSTTVSITNVATGVTTNVTANAQGIYNAPNLLPGNYQVTVSAPGFQTAIESGVILTVGAQQ